LTTIAAVHGVTFGGGFELALTCDLIIADKMARFCFPELRLGLIPGFGGIPRLKRDLGNAVVRDLLLTGRSFNANKAQQIGLVSQVVGEGEALRAARATAAQFKKIRSCYCGSCEKVYQADSARRVAAGDRFVLRIVFASGSGSWVAQVCGEHGGAALLAVVECRERVCLHRV
jgi:enoyl-CoA hydratase/carnithine racemase